MNLPKKFGQNKEKKAPEKYSDTNFKLFLLSLDDLHMNRYKNGWFTLLKFTEQVKIKPEVMNEMRSFS